jgi:hypothetical protein
MLKEVLGTDRSHRVCTMANRKELPRQTVQNLIPPAKDYTYFEAPLENPFQARANQFNGINAGWLIDASLLAYGDEDFIRARVAPLAAAVPGAHVQEFHGSSTQALVLSTNDFAIVAFRGTRTKTFADPIALVERAGGPTAGNDPPSGQVVFLDWRDVLSDINLSLGPGGIHRGFRAALDQENVWDQILPYLLSLEKRTVWFTGHSLGAALATIAAARFAAVRPVQGLYTFGSPRVGTAVFTSTVPAATWRVVNNQDLVARLPPPIAGYEHVGTLKSIDAGGVLADRVTSGDPLTERIQRALTGWTGPLADLIRQGTGDPADLLEQIRQLDFEIPDNGLNDHAPINYACRVWNNT